MNTIKIEINDHKPSKVRLDGKICGEIRQVEGGFCYYPKGKKKGGEVFKTLWEVEQSLQDDA